MLTPSRFRIITAVLTIAVLTIPAIADSPAPTQQQQRFEIRFMEQMIDHHTMAIMMAQMCVEKAQTPELVQTCQNIIATQSAEVEQMQSWLSDWYGISYSPKPSNAGMRKLMKLSGAEFEIEFMQEMIEHHADAIREGTECLTRAYHQELRDLCQNIIITQSQEINTMRTWLCEWYGVCDPI